MVVWWECHTRGTFTYKPIHPTRCSGLLILSSAFGRHSPHVTGTHSSIIQILSASSRAPINSSKKASSTCLTMNSPRSGARQITATGMFLFPFSSPHFPYPCAPDVQSLDLTLWPKPRCGNLASILTIAPDGGKSFSVFGPAEENERDNVGGPGGIGKRRTVSCFILILSFPTSS